MDSALKPVSRKTYQFAYPFFQGRSVVKIKGKYGLINSKEELLTECVYDTIGYERGVPIGASRNKQNVLLDNNGKVLENYPMGCGGGLGTTSYFFTYRKNGKIGTLDWSKSAANNNSPDSLPALYDKLIENGMGYAYVKLNGKWGAIDLLNKTVLPLNYDSVIVKDMCVTHLACNNILIKDGLFGFTNYKAEAIIEPKYIKVKPFLVNFALVEFQKGKWGYVDEKGREYFK